jgi:hypothetical protein
MAGEKKGAAPQSSDGQQTMPDAVAGDTGPQGKPDQSGAGQKASEPAPAAPKPEPAPVAPKAEPSGVSSETEPAQPEDQIIAADDAEAIQSRPGEVGVSILKERLVDARLMLAHAAEAGLQVKPEFIATIEKASEAFAANRWTMGIAKEFWPVYAQLCALIKPVTGESLAACASKDLVKTLRAYRLGALWLAMLLLPLSVVMFVNTSITNEISDRIKDNDALAVGLRDQLLAIQPVTRPDQAQTPGAPITSRPRNERDVVTTLQQFATANRFLYNRANLLNHFIASAERDPFADASATEKREILELPVKLPDIPAAGFEKIANYQEIRSYAKNVQQMNLVLYGAVTAYLLPILYALLGACAYALRSISEQTLAKTYRPSHAAFARIIIALIAGLVVGLFNNFTQGISLSPLAIAFLVGYAVEIFFSFLDAFLETLKKVRS